MNENKIDRGGSIILVIIAYIRCGYGCFLRVVVPASACSYPISQLLPRKIAPIDPAVQSELQERIDHLESLIRSLAPGPQVTAALEDPTDRTSCGGSTLQATDSLAKSFGRINLHDGESSYTENNHWTSILDEISSLKDIFSDRGGSPDSIEQKLHPGLGLFLDQTSSVSQIDILSVLPPRPLVDGLVANYFSSADMPVTLVIHRTVFIRQYESFWERPLEQPIIWVAILFGMMFTTAYNILYVTRDVALLDETTLAAYVNIVAIAREKMIQCLHMGNYMKGVPHTIESLLSLVIVEYLQGDEAQYGCWQLIGVTIRIALKMGYHRDGSHFSNVSVYEAEMRRRAWFILRQFDIASAAQVGLPRIVRELQCDTMEPRSLYDDDFDESTEALPPGRPHTEHTLAQFLIYKSRVVAVYGKICDFTTSAEQQNYNEAMRLDTRLNNAFTQKPAILELKPMQSSILDGAQLITRRLHLAMAYHRAQMVLHRKFMILGKHQARYDYSYKTCTAAALSVLRHQEDIFEQSGPGRMLHADRWKLLSLTQSEFLFATTILCLTVDNYLAISDMAEHVKRLQISRAIWVSQMDLSKEAQTAVKAIDAVLNKASAKEAHIVQDNKTVSTRHPPHRFRCPDPQQLCSQDFPAKENYVADSHATALNSIPSGTSASTLLRLLVLFLLLSWTPVDTIRAHNGKSQGTSLCSEVNNVGRSSPSLISSALTASGQILLAYSVGFFPTTTMISQRSPLPPSPHFCEDLSICPPVNTTPLVTTPTQTDTRCTIKLSAAAQRLYDFVLARYKYDPDSTPDCEAKVEIEEWDLIHKKAREQEVADIYEYFLIKTKWEWDAPKKGETLGTLRVMGRESKLHSKFAANFEGALYAALVGVRLGLSPTSRARDAAAELEIDHDSSIQLDEGDVRKPDGSFGYKDIECPPLVIEVLASQKEKDFREKLDLYFRASDVRTVIAVVIGGPDPEEMGEASYRVFRKVVSAGHWETAKKGPFAFRDKKGELIDGDGDATLPLMLNDFLPAAEMLPEDEDVPVTVSHAELKKLLNKAVVSEAKSKQKPVAQTTKRKQPAPTPSQFKSSPSPSPSPEQSKEDEAYRGPSRSAQDSKRPRISTRSTPSASAE
ncbi:hypothetical protein OPT61_g3173 [Boeremia exigua]|uniref:Uncharacterized protein n=1 Tax=Boeremia exigua TaxID=749465 RepID=A0ACC2IIQ7_9PLEO|nr:hypothetical protein OPT61_g3173 [Boeremia exigua]